MVAPSPNSPETSRYGGGISPAIAHCEPCMRQYYRALFRANRRIQRGEYASALAAVDTAQGALQCHEPRCWVAVSVARLRGEVILHEMAALAA